MLAHASRYAAAYAFSLALVAAARIAGLTPGMSAKPIPLAKDSRRPGTEEVGSPAFVAAFETDGA